MCVYMCLVLKFLQSNHLTAYSGRTDPKDFRGVHDRHVYLLAFLFPHSIGVALQEVR